VAGLGLAGALLKPEFTTGSFAGPTFGVMGDPFHVDPVTKTIHYTGSEGRISVMELYSWCMEEWDKPEMMEHEIPMIARTPTIYDTWNGWRVSEATMPYLMGGSLVNGDDLWTNIVTVGRVKDDTIIELDDQPIAQGQMVDILYPSEDEVVVRGRRDGRVKTEFRQKIGYPGSYYFALCDDGL
jgi:hypothetical protein